LAVEEEAGPSTIIVSSSNDELDDDYWEKLGASFSDDELDDTLLEKLGS
jgi:hypothetical protein